MALKMNYWEKLFHTCAIVWGTAFIVGYSGIANAELTSTSSVTAKVTDYTKTVIDDNFKIIEPSDEDKKLHINYFNKS